MLTLQVWLQDAVSKLHGAGVHSPETDAVQLLQHITGLTRAELQLFPQTLLTTLQETQLAELLQRRVQREPLQLIVGETEFYGLPLQVAQGVLIPRPETEVLVYEALKHIPNHAKVLDMGCGTGAIALALKHENPTLEITAADIDPAAVNLARDNAKQLNLNITVLHSNMFEHITGVFDVLISNPPYLPRADAINAFPELAYEHPQALYSGEEGLDFTRQLLAEAEPFLSSNAQIFLELDPRNVDHLAVSGYEKRIFADLLGRKRFIHGYTAFPLKSAKK